MRKKINGVRHFGILFLTIIIFSLGILIGGSIESQRVQSIYTQLQNEDLEYQKTLTESYYIDYIVSKKGRGENISCEFLEGTYFTTIQNLDDSRVRLENYINSGSTKAEEFQRLKEHYVNVQVNYFVLAQKIKNICKSNFETILYFYDDKKKCPECEDQGVHLNYVKNKLKDKVLVFSFDITFKGPVNLLSQTYNTKNMQTPIIIIDEKKYNFLTNEEIFKDLCEIHLTKDFCSN